MGEGVATGTSISHKHLKLVNGFLGLINRFLGLVNGFVGPIDGFPSLIKFN